jgi:hypothetical protein
MQLRLTPAEEKSLRNELEERADYLPNDELISGTATNDFFDDIQRKLIGRGTKLVVGPRGCGKTHMMRFAQLSCIEDASSPFAIYVSFNRYYRLEPMLQSKANAIRLFQVWTLANTLLATINAVRLFDKQHDAEQTVGLGRRPLETLIARLETAAPLDTALSELASTLTVKSVIDAIERTTEKMPRKRCILLLDDAALTLTPDYLVEFFEIVRTIKTQLISPKASIYPGTTEYGPRFHAHHESEEVPVWLSLESSDYESMMGAIASKRFGELDKISTDIADQIRYAAFGVPRAYLTMLRRFVEGGGGSTQQALNATIDEHMNARLVEFQSLASKVPKFASLVEVGQSFFHRCVETLRDANIANSESATRQLLIGLQDEPGVPLRERMLSLLLEAGLLYEHPKVAHGEDRKYRRFTPHLAALMQQRAFSSRQRGVSPKAVVEFLRRAPSKHPVRRVLSTILGPDDLSKMNLSLPPCAKCNTARISESQSFCHHCGAELLTASTFKNYLSFPLVDVPGLTEWQRQKIPMFTGLKTIGDLLAYQDPGSELRKIPWVGHTRAKNMIELVHAHVDDFFS